MLPEALNLLLLILIADVYFVDLEGLDLIMGTNSVLEILEIFRAQANYSSDYELLIFLGLIQSKHPIVDLGV